MTKVIEMFDNRNDQLKELTHYLNSLKKKIHIAEVQGQLDVSRILGKVGRDIQRWIIAFEDNQASFHEARQEIASLHIFSEIYIELDEMGFH